MNVSSNFTTGKIQKKLMCLVTREENDVFVIVECYIPDKGMYYYCVEQAS